MFLQPRRRRVHAPLVVSLLCLAVSTGCGDSSGPDPGNGNGNGGGPLEISVDQPGPDDRFLESEDIDLSATIDGSVDSVVWRSSRDGRLGRGTAIVATGFSVGLHDITATAFGAGESASDGVSIRIETLPDVTIVEPAADAAFPPSQTVDLVGEASDRDGGGTTLTWRSSLDGALGSGANVQASGLAYGRHTIWLIATDDEGQSDSASVDLTVQDYALEFDGIDDGASTPDHPDLDLASTWTIEFWLYPMDLPDGEHYLISKWSGNTPDRSFAILLEDSDIFYFRTFNGNTGRGGGRTGLIQQNAWQHFAVVYDQGSLDILKNGAALFSTSGWQQPQVGDAPVSLGRQWWAEGTTHAHFNGRMDEVRIWNVARSQDEIIQTISTRLNGDEPGLVAYWRMEEGAGDQVTDLTGRGHTLQFGDAAGSDAADPTWHLPGADIR